MNKLTVAIISDHMFYDTKLFDAKLDFYLSQRDPQQVKLICDDLEDSFGELNHCQNYAEKNSIELQVYAVSERLCEQWNPSEYEQNQSDNIMIDDANCLIAFWDGDDEITGDAIKYAREKGIPVRIVPIDWSEYQK